MLRPLLGLLLVPILLSACGSEAKDVTCGQYLGMSSAEQRHAVEVLFKGESSTAESVVFTQKALVAACRGGGGDSKDVTLKSIVQTDDKQLDP